MKQKELIFNFVVNRNWKKLTDSGKRAKILANNCKSYHPIDTLFQPPRPYSLFLEHGSAAKTLISHLHNTASYAGYSSNDSMVRK